jgi:YD repeat-containing protein
MAQPYDGWGNVIVIRSIVQGLTEPVWFIYGHLSQGIVAVGQIVHSGTRIGQSGNTGSSTGPHLHFQADRDTLDSRGQQQVQHPWFPTMIGRSVDTRDTDGAVTRYTYNPLYLIQGQSTQQSTPNVQITFNPNSVIPSPDLYYHYTVAIKNTSQQSINLTKMTLGSWDGTQYINQWFGTTTLAAGDTRSVSIRHPIGMKDSTLWTFCGNVSGGQSGLCWSANISLQ